MNFTLRHIVINPDETEREFIVAANRVWYESAGEENTSTGIVRYDQGHNSPLQSIEGAGKVYVTNENGKTVATYHLGYTD